MHDDEHNCSMGVFEGNWVKETEVWDPESCLKVEDGTEKLVTKLDGW